MENEFEPGAFPFDLRTQKLAAVDCAVAHQERPPARTGKSTAAEQNARKQLFIRTATRRLVLGLPVTPDFILA
jgi:hypothetical protein